MDNLINSLPKWFYQEYFGMFNWQWLAIVVAFFVGLLLKRLTKFVLEVFKKFSKHSKSTWDDKLVEAAEKPIGLIVACLFWFTALHNIKIDTVLGVILLYGIKIIFGLSLIWLGARLVSAVAELTIDRKKPDESQFDAQVLRMIAKAARILVIVFGVLVLAQNLGINVASLLAGLGLGGLAFALAAKDTAANLFGSIMIMLDQPFKIGDWVITDGSEGSVEDIGFRSTRIRTFYNSLISVPNSKLATTNIDNMGKRRYRRIKTTLGLTYDTPPEKISAFVEGVKNLIQNHEHTRKDYYHVAFNNFSPSSLDILLYLFLEVPDWSKEIEAREDLFLKILTLAKTQGVSFAFPTQSIHVESMPKQ